VELTTKLRFDGDVQGRGDAMTQQQVASYKSCLIEIDYVNSHTYDWIGILSNNSSIKIVCV